MKGVEDDYQPLDLRIDLLLMKLLSMGPGSSDLLPEDEDRMAPSEDFREFCFGLLLRNLGC